jgi:hypothetical protein
MLGESHGQRKGRLQGELSTAAALLPLLRVVPASGLPETPTLVEGTKTAFAMPRLSTYHTLDKEVVLQRGPGARPLQGEAQ